MRRKESCRVRTENLRFFSARRIKLQVQLAVSADVIPTPASAKPRLSETDLALSRGMKWPQVSISLSNTFATTSHRIHCAITTPRITMRLLSSIAGLLASSAVVQAASWSFEDASVSINEKGGAGPVKERYVYIQSIARRTRKHRAFLYT